MSTGVCSCKLNMSNKTMSLVQPTDSKKFKGAESCPGFSWGDLGKSVAENVAFGLPSLFGMELPKPDDAALNDIKEKNDNLKDMFQACQFQIVNCRLQQSVDFMSKQLELSKALQKITDETQNQMIAKNMSLTYYAIAIATLTVMYILAMPTPPPTF